MTESTNPLDQQKSFNIFTASYGEVFLKNFLSGLGRALGAIIIYLILFSIIFWAVSRFLLPQFQSMLQSLPKQLMPAQSGSSMPVDLDQLQQLLPQLTQ